MIRYRLWVWVLCLIFPTWVWAENTTRTCTSFTQQGRQVTFHLADSAALQLQLCSSSVVKIWFSPDGQLQRRNASFAVINEELEEVFAFDIKITAYAVQAEGVADLAAAQTELDALIAAN